MGIDKSNVRYVVHRDMPRSIEAWYQEIGRAGRDGLASDCFVFYSWVDVLNYDAFLDEVVDTQLRAETAQRTRDLFRLLERRGCRHQALVAYFDETIAPCGDACDVCLGLGVDAPSPASPPTPSLRKPSWQQAVRPEVMEDPDRAADAAKLFDQLRVRRRQLADAEGKPAYIVFSDAVLREMALRRPTSEAALLKVPGVGAAKLERYGAAFLEVLRG
jgi:ATP-dependent DNA helicase RecQ